MSYSFHGLSRRLIVRGMRHPSETQYSEAQKHGYTYLVPTHKGHAIQPGVWSRIHS